jgi:chromosomal replication initiation ATPase DnaA
MLNNKKIPITTIVNQIAIMYKIDAENILKMGSRKSHIIEARRIYNYYLYKEKKIRHYNMHEYIKGIDHSTSIYHCKKIEELFSIDKDLKVKYIELLYLCDTESFFNLHKNPTFSTLMNSILTLQK